VAAVWYRFRAERRSRRRATVALVLVVGLAGGLVLVAVAVAVAVAASLLPLTPIGPARTVIAARTRPAVVLRSE
jgi:hypothetical protein